MGNDDSELQSNTTYDIVIAALYTLTIGVNVYIIVNELTDGALQTSVSMRLTKLRAKLSEKVKHERAVRKDFGKVLWEATTTVEESTND